MGDDVLASSVEDLKSALRALLRPGLPLTDDSAGDVLPNQRVVYASAQHPHERASRVSALDRILTQQLKNLGTSRQAQAARILFACDRNHRGTTLTTRREEAAHVLERHPDHLRKHIEPKLIEQLAFALHQENLRYTPTTDRTRPPLAAHEDTPALVDASYTEEEELLCRVWSAVYGYRAEIVAISRRLQQAEAEDREPDPDLTYHLDSARWQLARLLTFVSDYLERYGDTILQGETPYNIEGLVQLAGWHGGLGSDEANALRLRLAASGSVDDRARFMSVPLKEA
jgi:hypothetical protein